MYPDSWIYRGFTSCNFDLWWKQNGGYGSDLQNTWLQVDYLCTDGFNLEILQHGLYCNVNFEKWHDICCLRAEFTAKHGKAPLTLTTRWWMEPDLGSWQSPGDISRSHLYRGTIAWTPPTAIYRAYTVSWLLMSWRRKEPRHQQPWYWPS